MQRLLLFLHEVIIKFSENDLFASVSCIKQKKKEKSNTKKVKTKKITKSKKLTNNI